MNTRRALFDLSCNICGSPFTSTKTDAIYCGSTCRQRAFRQRRRQNAIAIEPYETRSWQGSAIQRRRADGYINATAMAKAGGKHLPHYLSNARTAEYLQALSGSVGIPTDLLTDSIVTGPNDRRATWIHPRLAVDLARWISPAFAVWMDGWILSQFDGKSVKPQPLKPINTVHGLALQLPRAIERYQHSPSEELATVISQSAIYVALMYNNPAPIAALQQGLAASRFNGRLAESRFIRDLQ